MTRSALSHRLCMSNCLSIPWLHADIFVIVDVTYIEVIALLTLHESGSGSRPIPEVVEGTSALGAARDCVIWTGGRGKLRGLSVTLLLFYYVHGVGELLKVSNCVWYLFKLRSRGEVESVMFFLYLSQCSWIQSKMYTLISWFMRLIDK
jgi:hypothetical protein